MDRGVWGRFEGGDEFQSGGARKRSPHRSPHPVWVPIPRAAWWAHAGSGRRGRATRRSNPLLPLQKKSKKTLFVGGVSEVTKSLPCAEEQKTNGGCGSQNDHRPPAPKKKSTSQNWGLLWLTWQVRESNYLKVRRILRPRNFLSSLGDQMSYRWLFDSSQRK